MGEVDFETRRAAYRALAASFPFDEEAAMATVGLVLRRAGVDYAAAGFPKLKWFLAQLDFVELRDVVLGGGPQTQVTLRRCPGLEAGGPQADAPAAVSENRPAGQVAPSPGGSSAFSAPGRPVAPSTAPVAAPAFAALSADAAAARPAASASAGASSGDSAPSPASPSAGSLDIGRIMAEAAASDEYREAPVSPELASQLGDNYADFVHNTFASREKLAEATAPGTDLDALLERSWAAARAAGALRHYEGKVIFPLAALRSDGVTPIEASIRPATQPVPGGKPWFLCYIGTYVRPAHRADSPSKALERFAWLGPWDEFLGKLADTALPEAWDFVDDAPAYALGSAPASPAAPAGAGVVSGSSAALTSAAGAAHASGGPAPASVGASRQEPSPQVQHAERHRYAILKSYICTTFYRLKVEGKVRVAPDGGFAAFNTGLVNRRYDDIYACFEPNTASSTWDWRFVGFAASGARGLGKQLVSLFNPLPEAASYFARKEDLLFDLDKDLITDYDHVLVDNISRLPVAFLEDELRGDGECADLLAEISSPSTPPADRAAAYERLGGIVEDDDRLFRRLRGRLMDAVETARKRVRWNFKTAIPSYYPRANSMSLLLPMCLLDDSAPDCALVVQLMPSGNYQGQTILTLRQAYMNARLICRPDSDWLTTASRPDSDSADADADE